MIVRKPCGCAQRMAATLRDVGEAIKARADSQLAIMLRCNNGSPSKALADAEARRRHAREMLDVTASEQLARFADTAEDARAVLDYAKAEADKIDAESEAYVNRCKATAKRAEEALLADMIARSGDVLGITRWDTGQAFPRMRRGTGPRDGPNTERLRSADFAAWSAVNAARQYANERDSVAMAIRDRAENCAFYAKTCTCSVEVVPDEGGADDT